MSARPKRIQLSRVKGWRLPRNTVVVSRPSRWGNPFRVGTDGTAEQCVRLFRKWLFTQKRSENLVPLLAGKNLACWCKIGEPCHADVLLRIANKT